MPPEALSYARVHILYIIYVFCIGKVAEAQYASENSKKWQVRQKNWLKFCL